MASPSVLTFDAEGRAVDFEVWLDDLQLFLQCDSKDGLSLFDLTSGASTAPVADADGTVCSQWTTRDAAARLAMRSHLPSTEHAHFSQYKSAKTLYDAVVARYSSPATAALCRLMLPYLFPDLAPFATVADLITHLRTSDTRYRAKPSSRAAEPPSRRAAEPHSTQRCFGRLTDAWRHQFPDATEIPHWGDLSRAGVAIFDLDYDAILATMYAVSYSAEGDCYLCVPPDPGIEAAALGTGEAAALGASTSAAPGAGESALSGTSSTQAFHTFTLDSGASRSFFRDRTTLTPLSRPVAVSLADPSGGPVLASFSTVLPCPAAPSGSLSGLYLPSFSTNLVSGADLQDRGVDQFTLAGQRVTHCMCARMGRHLATFTRRPGSSLYTLTTASPPVAESGQVAASSKVFAAASRSGPESAPCSCLLVSGLPQSLPPLPPGHAPTCVPCVEGRQRAAPHSSEFPPTEAPLQMLHMDVWGLARVSGQGHERYFLLVVDDYSHYTTVFPLRSKGDVTEVLIVWIQASRGTSSMRELLSPQELREWFARRWSRAAGARGTTVAAGSGGTRTGGAGAVGAGGAAEAAGVGPARGTAGATGGTGAAGPAGTCVAGATGARAAGGVGAGGSADAGTSEGAGAGAIGARGAAGTGAAAEGAGALPAGFGGAARPRPYFIPLLEQPASPLLAPSPYTGPTRGLAERREPESCPASPVRAARTSRRAPRPRPPPVPGTHQMALRPSTAPLRVSLPSPLESSLPVLADPVSDSFCAASPTLVDFAAHCRLDYSTGLVAESASVFPPSVRGECALSTDVLEDRQEEFQCFAAALPHLVSTLTAPEGDPDALDIPTPRSYAEAIEGTYVDEVPPPGANIVSGMWIFRTFSPTPKMTTLWVLLHVAAQCDYELHSLDFSRAFLQGSLHEEIWLRRPPGFTGSFPPGLLAALGFAPSTADPSLFVRTDTSLPPFYILVYVDDLVFANADTAGLAHVKSELQKRHTCTDMGPSALRFHVLLASSHSSVYSLSALPSDESVEPSGLYPELVGCLMYLMTCTRPDLAYPLSILACYVAPGRH
ncbi:unnamed protein product [Closterium sp. NIES-53]